MWYIVCEPLSQDLQKFASFIVKLNKIMSILLKTIFRKFYSHYSQLHKDFFSNSRSFFKFLYNRPEKIYAKT